LVRKGRALGEKKDGRRGGGGEVLGILSLIGGHKRKRERNQRNARRVKNDERRGTPGPLKICAALPKTVIELGEIQ